MAALLSSCYYKDFGTYHGTVPVKFVFDYDSIDFRPQMMRLVVYPLDGQFTEPMVRDFRDTLTVNLPAGHYRVAAFNDDSGILRYSDYDTMDGKVTISSGIADKNKTLKLDTIPGATFYDYPDRVATVYEPSLDIAMPTDNTEAITVHLLPTEATSQVHVTISGMRHMNLLQQVELCLDSCYVAYYVSAQAAAPPIAFVVSPDARIAAEDNVLTANFNIFGLPTDDGHTLRLILNGMGFSHILNFGLDGKIERRAGSRDVWINLCTDFDIDKLVPKGSGFDVDVDEWTTDSAELKL